jgi:hypothetical protein
MNMESNISIITNFGCRQNCWYCIWKNHPLKNVQLEIDWTKLISFLQEYKYKGKVSVSGGGDCLYNFYVYENWWKKLFYICGSLGIKIDVHSREVFLNPIFWKAVNKCVVSSDSLKDDEQYFKYVRKFTQLRIVHVVTQRTTDEMIEDYINFSNRFNCQFTIKQLVGYPDGNRYYQVRRKYPDIFHLDKGDYNIYYMPDNTVTTKFLENGK